MISYEMQDLTMQQIDIFFRCAEEMNFTKVAQALHITPGMVSKKIAAMESSLGFALFRREKNRVSLTPEGEALYAAWRQPVKTMVRQVREIKGRAVRNSTLRFALWESTNLERFFVPLISAFSAEVETLFQVRMWDDFSELEDLVSGKLDIAFVPRFAEKGIREMEELECFLAQPSALYAALSQDSPLSRKKCLTVGELAQSTVIIPENEIPWYTDMLQALFASNGVAPTIKKVPMEVFKTSYLSLPPDDVMITDKYFHAFASNAVEHRELVGTVSGLLMVYRRDAPFHVKRFVEIARTFYKELR